VEPRDRPGVNTPTSCVRGVSPISSCHPGRSADASPGSSPAYDRRLGPSDRTQNRWWARSGFRRLGRSGPTPADARSPGAYRATTNAAASTAPEVHRLATTVDKWWPAVLAGLQTGYSNSRSEGYNRLAKHEGRNAFGFRDPIKVQKPDQGSETRSTSDDAYAGPAPANTDGKQPGKPLCPVNFEEP